MLQQRTKCFCAFCKTTRKVYRSKNLSFIEVLGLIFLGVVLTFVVFKSFDPRGLGFVGSLLIIGEIFTQVKWRSAMVCQNCGFDPVLYLRSHEQAGLKIKAFLEKRADSPAHLLRPPVVLPKVKANSRSFIDSSKPSAPSKNLSLKV